jgi:hypothetical protein
MQAQSLVNKWKEMVQVYKKVVFTPAAKVEPKLENLHDKQLRR